MFEALLGAGMGIFGSIFNNIMAGDRAQQQNEAQMAQTMYSAAINAQQAEINRAFQANQSGIQRDFQQSTMNQAIDESRYLSNTSWQRGVNDMREAGINPILAITKGGASTPTFSGMSGSSGSGSQASVSGGSMAAAQVFDMVAPMLASAKAVQEIKNLQAQEEKTQAETDTERNRPENVKRQSELYKGTAERTAVQTTRELAEVPVSQEAGQLAKTRKEGLWDTGPGKALIIGGAGAQSVNQILSPVSSIVGGMATTMQGLAARSNALTRQADFTSRYGHTPQGYISNNWP